MRLVAASAVAAATLAVQPAPQPVATSATASSGIVVHVDVFPTDSRGRIVETLKPGDFEVRENGVVQTLDQIRFIKIDGKGPSETLEPIRSEVDEQAEAARENTRLFAILLDEYHVSPGEADRVRDALTRFVTEDIGALDLLTVMKPLDSLFTIRLTRDRDVVLQAIKDFQGRMGDYTPRNDFERKYVAGTPARLEQIRAQVATSALNALALHLGYLSERRKAIVLVSHGFVGTARRRGFEPLPTIDSVLRAANRFNVSIYAIDPEEAGWAPNDGFAAPADDQAATELLRTLTNTTDGGPLIDSASLGGAMHRIVTESSAYYLLTYRSQHPDDGAFQPVQVRVKKPGVMVRARKGYWAPLPDEALAAEMLARAKAPGPSREAALEPAWHISTLIKPWFGVARGASGRMRVTFVWEPAARVPGDRARRVDPSRITLKALGPDGATLFDRAVLPVTPASVEGRDNDEAKAVFDTPPGRLRLRMSIEGPGSQLLDSDVREISIRDLRQPVALGSAEMFRSRNAREFHEIESDPSAVPVAAREFSRSERLVVRFAAYTPPGSNPRVSARLMSRMGGAMRSLTVVAPTGSDDRSSIDLPLAGLAPGEYLIELSVSCAAGEAKDLVGFRVTN